MENTVNMYTPNNKEEENLCSYIKHQQIHKILLTSKLIPKDIKIQKKNLKHVSHSPLDNKNEKNKTNSKKYSKKLIVGSGLMVV